MQKLFESLHKTIDAYPDLFTTSDIVNSSIDKLFPAIDMMQPLIDRNNQAFASISKVIGIQTNFINQSILLEDNQAIHSLLDAYQVNISNNIWSSIDAFRDQSWFESITANLVTGFETHHLVAFDLLSQIEPMLSIEQKLYIPDILMDIRFPSLLETLEDIDKESQDTKEQEKPVLYIADITPELIKYLADNPDEIFKLSAEEFERLVLDRIRAMGYNAERVTESVYAKDGGVDIIARPKTPGLIRDWIVIQVKHHASNRNKVGAQTVSQLAGVLTQNCTYFSAAMLVTNTSFSSAARSWEKPYLTLKDGQDLVNWLKNNFKAHKSNLNTSTPIELRGGIIIPNSRLKSLWEK